MGVVRLRSPHGWMAPWLADGLLVVRAARARGAGRRSASPSSPLFCQLTGVVDFRRVFARGSAATPRPDRLAPLGRLRHNPAASATTELAMTKFTPRVFSGVQPTGNLHLGNYLGAIKRFVELQKTHECIYCVVDLHAITVPMSVWGGPKELASATRQVTAAFIAAGIDPKKHIVFNQSQVPAHAELAWIFNCVARLGWLNRMTQFKEKAGKDRENASIGLYDYPVLMAADILAYLATHVPVGDDQKQHLELARDIAIKFNNDFAESIAAHGFGDAFFPVHRAADHRPGDARHVAPRRHQEDVEVGPVRLFAHQPHRRRRDHRAEAPQGEDRSRSRCPPTSRA